MTILPPSDAAGAAEARLRNLERRLAALETSRRLPFSDIYDEDGNLALRLSADGLAVFDDLGAAQLRAGDLNGLGDYGVEIGGGRARAFDMQTYHSSVENAPLTSTPAPVVSVEVTPPPWALNTHIFAWLTFQMGNHRTGLHRQRYRTDIDGQPGTGFWNNDVQVNSFANVTDVQRLSLAAPFSTILVQGVAGVDIGTNGDNYVRLHAFAWFTR